MNTQVPRFAAVVLVVIVFGQAASAAPPQARRQGLVVDWSTHRVVYPGLTSANVAAKAERDPRVWGSWLKHSNGALLGRGRRIKRKHHRNIDWSASLGAAAAGLPPGAMAAKYNFSLSAAPSCANDYLAYGLNVAGSATQANIIAFNNLYSSGVVAGGGLCDAANLGQPKVLFAFNTAAAAVAGSLALSLDGKKVAFTASPAGGAKFYVLTWGTGGGTATVPLAPDVACVTSCLQSVPLGVAANASSSPFVDYNTDTAFIGDNSGKIWKIKNVFNGIPAKATTDPNWPASGFFQTSTAGALNSPVFAYNKIFVTDAAGTLHVISPAAAPAEATTTLDATGGAGSSWDAPIVSFISAMNATVFAFGQDSLSSPIVLQTDLTGAALQRVSLLGDGTAPTYDGTFDNTYFSAATPNTGFLYVCTTNSNSNAGASPVGALLWRIPFNNSTTMATTADTSPNGFIAASKIAGAPCSPLTEIYNPNDAAHTDKLFVQVGHSCDLAGNGCVKSFDISGAAIALVKSVMEASTTPGTSGAITIDNTSTAAQASSIYFAVPGSAIKLTQSGLQ